MYLDYAASTPVKPEVLREFNNIAEHYYANPSSEHRLGLDAERIVKDAQELIAKKLNCSSAEIYFTSGATMSNNIAIQGFMRKEGLNAFLSSAVEHDDIMLVADYLHGGVRENYAIPVDSEGIIKLDILNKRLQKLTSLGFRVLVSIQLANSESGVVQPVTAISEIIHKYPNCYFHTDATQYLPYFDVDVQRMGIDMLSMSGQKIGGIKGSGILYVKDGINLVPVIFGKQGLVGGTYATPLIASLTEAFYQPRVNNKIFYDNRDYLLKKLEALGGVLVGNRYQRLPNNIYIRFPGIQGNILLKLLSEQEIYVSTGSACSSNSDEPSHVALAYGLTEQQATECIRFTIGETLTKNDIDYIGKVIESNLMLLR